MTLPKTAETEEIQDIRIPKIIELRLQGATWEEAAQQVGLSVRGVYDLRKRDDFHNYLNTLIPLYDLTIRELLQSDNESTRLGAAREYGTMIRSGIPKQVHQRLEKAEIKIILHDFNPQLKNESE